MDSNIPHFLLKSSTDEAQNPETRGPQELWVLGWARRLNLHTTRIHTRVASSAPPKGQTDTDTDVDCNCICISDIEHPMASYVRHPVWGKRQALLNAFNKIATTRYGLAREIALFRKVIKFMGNATCVNKTRINRSIWAIMCYIEPLWVPVV